MQQFLDFEKEKVQSITIDQLMRTHKENDVYGNPLQGIYHYQLVNEIVNMCKEYNYNVEIYDMFAAQNKDRKTPGVVILPQVEQTYGKNAVEAHILRRVFTNVRLTDFDDEENTTNLAIAFHQRGIQVGFGNMVKICHNQCMLGAEQYASTYGEKGTGRKEMPSISDIKDIVKSWLVDARQIVVKERSTIEAMKNIEVGMNELIALIGLMTATRVKCDTLIKEIRENRTYPLNQAQISRFTEKMLVNMNENGRTTVWEIYNAATDLYKATDMDIPQMLPQNKAMVEMLNGLYHFQ